MSPLNESGPPAVSIRVRLGECSRELRVAEGTLSGDLCALLPPEWRGHILVVINGRVAGPGVRLHAGDRVVILPQMGGG